MLYLNRWRTEIKEQFKFVLIITSTTWATQPQLRMQAKTEIKNSLNI